MHAEAFAQLSTDQRRQVLADLSRDLPAGEQAPSDDPQSMAQYATRAELRRPGYLEKAFGGLVGAGAARGRGGLGMGGTVMGSMMGTMAGVVVGSMVADALLDGFDSSPEAAGVGDASATADSGDTGGAGGTGSSTDAAAGADSTGYDSNGADAAGADAGGYDSRGMDGGDFGGGGADFGGGF